MALVALVVSMGVLTGCTTTPTTKVLVDEPALLVTAEGSQVDVYDRQSGETYTFHSRLKKRTEGDVEAHRAVISTDTMQVTPLPHGGLEIVTLTDGKVYKITHRWGVF
jgi:hypothetical protein